MKKDYSFLNHPSIIIITGGRGAGKSAEAHGILEMFHTKGIPCFFYAPKSIVSKPEKYFEGGKPDWLNFCSRQLNENSVTLFDDAQLMAHAREWYRNIALDKLCTLSRHKKSSIIYTTQQTIRVDRNLVAEVDCIIFKQPSLMAPHTEKPFIQRLLKVVNQEFDDYENKNPEADLRSMSYCICNKPRYTGMVGPTSLPSYWTEELSSW